MSDLSEIDDAERLRIGDVDDEAAYGRLDPGSAPVGATVLAVTKAISSYPSGAGRFVACTTKALIGTETEGSAGVGTSLGDTFYAYVPSGAAVPSNGSEVICVCVPYRWVMAI